MNETVICAYCHEEIKLEDAVVFDGRYICKTCYHESTVTCDDCGRVILCHDAESDARRTLCRSCFTSHYLRCDSCNCIIPDGQAFYLDDDEDTPLCGCCYDLRNQSHTIRSYYYKPTPVFCGTGPRYFGVELEIDDGGESDVNASKLLNATDSAAEYFYIKHDGSLEDGMELVSHPADLKSHMDVLPWPEVMDEAVDLGYRSHETKTCGLHIHINRSSFGETAKEQDAVIARLLYFVENHWNEILKFSRRTAYQMERWAARYGRKDHPKEVLDIAKKAPSGRYSCINLTNNDTVEFRMFRGTLRWNTFAATLQFVDALCDVAAGYSDESLSELSWSDFVRGLTRFPELVQYLKERNLYVNEPVYAAAEV